MASATSTKCSQTLLLGEKAYWKVHCDAIETFSEKIESASRDLTCTLFSEENT